jgi:hypothetical protein
LQRSSIQCGVSLCVIYKTSVYMLYIYIYIYIYIYMTLVP